ncbi:periplasmic endochitinase [Shigella sonnei]|nr:periplasmic endochitinase [Shigella sonnei]
MPIINRIILIISRIIIGLSEIVLSKSRIRKGTSAFDIAHDGNDSNLLIVFYVQIIPDDFVMQLHRF